MHYLGSNLSQFHGNLYVYVVYQWVQEILNTGSFVSNFRKGSSQRCVTEEVSHNTHALIQEDIFADRRMVKHNNITIIIMSYLHHDSIDTNGDWSISN